MSWWFVLLFFYLIKTVHVIKVSKPDGTKTRKFHTNFKLKTVNY